ncbi:MarR family transcriptional regulator [Winogradskya humida]|uniref:DNA-binding MarR family transcriptional regulator n=1 Tax=Winogradskya humida TaxID=113566 RepID=A0ABQ4A3P7_9ACTN|nr:MarR family transcriptional regulator [Actinoplanes humidus]GIE25238.1 hypothetical protein Ahu01nite_083400 [Actinoplanes humidus]
MKDYSEAELARQPIGYWSGEAYRIIVGRIRAALAEEQLTQPHWWMLNHVSGAPGEWGRVALAERLRRFDDLGISFDDVFDDLVGRGWMVDTGATLTLTEDGLAGLARARERNARVHEQTHQGITTAEYAAALTVLRRMIDNLGGDSDLP